MSGEQAEGCGCGSCTAYTPPEGLCPGARAGVEREFLAGAQENIAAGNLAGAVEDLEALAKLRQLWRRT